MVLSGLQRAIQRRGVDRLIVVLMQLVAGKTMKEVNSQQRAIFNRKIVKLFGSTTATQMPEDTVPLVFERLCQLAVRKEFSLISTEHLGQRINFVGRDWLTSKLKETLEEFIMESASQPRSLSFSTGCLRL